MEEKLIRGKHRQTGNWIFWNLFGEYTEPFYCKKTDTMHSHVSETDIIPGTVGHFTGFLDKKGVKIFEGDTFRTFTGHDSPVVFENGAFRLDPNYTLADNDPENGWVVGNIYQGEVAL